MASETPSDDGQDIVLHLHPTVELEGMRCVQQPQPIVSVHSRSEGVYKRAQIILCESRDMPDANRLVRLEYVGEHGRGKAMRIADIERETGKRIRVVFDT